MRNSVTYYLLVASTIAFIFCSCGNRLNKRVTLWRNDKIPYGTYYAYNNLQYIFTDADIEPSAESPITFYQDSDASSAYIIIGLMVKPDERELNAILNHAISGNHVFISALDIGKNLLDSFKLSVSEDDLFFHPDSLNIKLENNATNETHNYSYPGYAIGTHFTKMDTSVTNVLGRDNNGNANFVKFNYQGGGAVYINLVPAAFTNFFLLHKNNKSYYDYALSVIPDTVSYVRWDDYYRHHINGNNNSNKSAFSKLKAFLENDVLRWAFWLAIILFAIIYLFESKRKQKAIPTQKKLNNTSLDFVKTVGRLYYQRKDNKNLGQKISTHFLGHVRSRYNLHTSQLDEDFENRLAYKSGYPIQLVKEIINGITYIETSYEITDEELMSFNEKIDTFINKS